MIRSVLLFNSSLVTPSSSFNDMAERLTQHEGFPLLTDGLTSESVPLFVENLLRGEKPREEWMCGVEFELFGYDRARSLSRIDAAQVQAVLAGFAPSSRDLVYEGGTVIEAADGHMSRLTVEPGGQVEFSGSPHRGLKEVERELP